MGSNSIPIQITRKQGAGVCPHPVFVLRQDFLRKVSNLISTVYTCPMIEITPSFSIDESELQFAFVRSSGPGGQNVNKVATAVQLAI